MTVEHLLKPLLQSIGLGVAAVDPDTLEPLETVAPGVRAIVAATIGDVRLIDNLELLPGDGT